MRAWKRDAERSDVNQQQLLCGEQNEKLLLLISFKPQRGTRNWKRDSFEVEFEAMFEWLNRKMPAHLHFFSLLRGVLCLYLTRDMHSLRHFTSLAVINCSNIFFVSTSSLLNRLCQSSKSTSHLFPPGMILSTRRSFNLLIMPHGEISESEQIFLLIVARAHCWLYGLDMSVVWCWKRELMGVPKCCWWCWRLCWGGGEEQEEFWRLKWIKLLTARFFPEQ